MLRVHVWRWRHRHYASAPDRKIQFSHPTLARIYYRWVKGGRVPQALALRYSAPVKLRKTQVLDFARLCINSDVRCLALAYGRLPRPLATVSGYRIALGGKPLRQIVRLFAARRLVDARTRAARAAVNILAKEEGA
jgi:hypothetical protein